MRPRFVWVPRKHVVVIKTPQSIDDNPFVVLTHPTIVRGDVVSEQRLAHSYPVSLHYLEMTVQIAGLPYRFGVNGHVIMTWQPQHGMRFPAETAQYGLARIAYRSIRRAMNNTPSNELTEPFFEASFDKSVLGNKFAAALRESGESLGATITGGNLVFSLEPIGKSVQQYQYFTNFERPLNP